MSCYITCVMLCYIEQAKKTSETATCVMLFDIRYVMLCYITYVILCYITCVMLCYITYVVLCYMTCV